MRLSIYVASTLVDVYKLNEYKKDLLHGDECIT